MVTQQQLRGRTQQQQVVSRRIQQLEKTRQEQARQQTQQQEAQQAQQQQLAAGQALGSAGMQQQAMQQADIQSMLQAGGIQQQLGQQALDAQRATELQRAYEPFQRAEFIKNIYAAGPTSQSGITAATTPTVNPLAQTVGTGIAAYQAYAASKPTSTTTVNKF